MFKMKLVLLAIFGLSLAGLSLAATSKCTDDPTLQTKNGKIRGVCKSVKLNSTSEGQNIYAWLAVPYAKPPTGEYRFKPPQSVDSWSGVLDATKMPDFCLNLANRSNTTNFEYLNGLLRTSTIQMSEDCLYLNIFMSESVYSNLSMASSPILVFFQNGNQNFFNPTNIVLTSDIILVTVNYRLDIFGFLHLKDNSESEYVEGNQAILDQSMALKWINDNANSFGGNSNRITLFGSHAGATYIGYQLMYKPSWTLFRNVILNSGSPVNLGKNAITSGLASSRAKSFLKDYLNCKDGHLIPCARRMDAVKLLQSSRNFLFHKISANNVLTYNFMSSFFGPVVEMRMFRESPIRAFRLGNFKKCNMIIGYKNSDSHSLVPNDFGLKAEAKSSKAHSSHHTLDFRRLVDALKKFYAFYPTHPFNNSEIIFNSILNHYTKLTEKNYEGSHLLRSNYYKTFMKIVNDESFACPTFKLIENVAKHVKVYLHINDIHEVREGDAASNNATSINTVAIELLSRWINFVKFDMPNDTLRAQSRTSELEWPAYVLSQGYTGDLDDDVEQANATSQVKDSLYLHFKNSGFNVVKMKNLDSCYLWNGLIPSDLEELAEIKKTLEKCSSKKNNHRVRHSDTEND